MSMLEGEEGERADDDYAKGKIKDLQQHHDCHMEASLSYIYRAPLVDVIGFSS